MTREEYTNLDVEDYFNYMGMLAAEVTFCSSFEWIPALEFEHSCGKRCGPSQSGTNIHIIAVLCHLGTLNPSYERSQRILTAPLIVQGNYSRMEKMLESEPLSETVPYSSSIQTESSKCFLYSCTPL